MNRRVHNASGRVLRLVGLVCCAVLVIGILGGAGPNIWHQLTYGDRFIIKVLPVRTAQGHEDLIVVNQVPLSADEPAINHVTLLDGTQGTMRWDSPPLQIGENRPAVAVDETRVFIAFDKQLQALNMDGSVSWSSPLNDSMGSCDECIVAQGSRIFVLTANTIHGFDTQNGTLLWSERLPRPLRRITLVGENPGLVSGVAFRTLNRDSGNVEQEYPLRCANAPDAGMPSGMDPLVFVDSTANALFLRLGQCVQRWNTQTSKVVWETAFGTETLEPLMNARKILSFDKPEWFMNDAALFVSTGDDRRIESPRALVRLDKITGAPQVLAQDTKHYLLPDLLTEQTILVRVRDYLGTTADQLWALDNQRGEQLWQQTPTPTGTWRTMEATGGVALVRFNVRPPNKQVKPFITSAIRSDFDVSILNASSGQTTSTSLTAFPLADVDWLGATHNEAATVAWLNFGTLVAVDLSSEQKLYQWP